MQYRTDDLRIENLRPLISPAALMQDMPLDDERSELVARGREQFARILHGRDDRLAVIIGPCSIHDPKAALDYAERLRRVADELAEELLVVMRAYFEKPRTTVGWKGLINDPGIDESFNINEGLRIGRRLLLDITGRGVPVGCEFLDPISPQFLADVVSWGAIGARTTESQIHRELASGLSMPIGFKNATDGNIQVAIDALSASKHPHHFLSVTKQGVAAVVATRGNRDAHVILRGGASGPNYEAASVAALGAALDAAALERRVMVDCSHANSGKDHNRQPLVASDVAAQVASGDRSIFGVMLESFLEDGNQKWDPVNSVYGRSITDKCMSWERSVPVLEELATATRQRRRGAPAARP